MKNIASGGDQAGSGAATVQWFLVWWILANAAGWSIGGIGSLMMGTSFGFAWPLSPGTGGRPAFRPDIFALELWGFISAVGAGIGIWAGGLQWTVLRRTRLSLRPWTFATAAGTAVGVVTGVHGATLALLLVSPWGDIAAWTVFGIVLGAFVGLAQWPVLRRSMGRADRWILTSAVAGGAGALAASSAAHLGSAAGLFRLRQEDLLTSVFFACVAGAVGGIITGPLLARLLQAAIARGAAK